MNLEKIKKTPEAAAALWAVVVGIIAHLFALTNPLHNYDNILQNPQGVGAGVTSGRWFLDFLGTVNTDVLDLNYNLPLTKGLAFIVLIALTSAILVNILKIRSNVSASLLGCLMVTFPAVCSTMAFRYTADYYGIALLLSVGAVWLIDFHKFGFAGAIVCIACSMGIYQAYVPFTIGLFVLLLIRRSLETDAEFSELVRKGFFYCFVLIAGVLLYFVMVKVSLALASGENEVVLDSYLGINNMGKIPMDRLPRLLKRAFSYGALFAVRNYCGLAPSAPLKLIWVLLIMLTVAFVGVILLQRKIKLLNILFCGLMGLMFPLAINFQIVMSPDNFPYTIMVYSIVLVGCAPLMLLEMVHFEKEWLVTSTRRVTVIFVLLITIYNGYYTNYNYTYLHYTNRQVENYLNGLTVQIRMTEGYTPDMKWIFVGDINDPDFWNIWDSDLAYGGFINCSPRGLLSATYSLHGWYSNYLGFGVPFASEEECAGMMERDTVDKMPCWPTDGSIQVIDDYVVVKFQEIDELEQ